MNKIFAALGIATILVVLAACSGGDSVEDYLARANRFIASSEYDSAIIELKNALQQDGQSGEARWLLGKAYLESGDVHSAKKELRHALTLGWSKTDVVPALAESLLAQGEYVQLRELTLAKLEPQAKADVLAFKAMSEFAQGEIEEARRLVNQALKQAPESTEALMTNTRVLTAEGDLEGVDKVLDTLLALHPENGRVWSLVGDIRTGQQRLDEALLAYDKAISFRANSYRTRFMRALLSLQTGRNEQAQSDVNELLDIAPQHPGANYIQGLIHLQAGRFSAAITALSVAETASRQYPMVLFYLGSAQLAEGHLDLAATQAARFHSVSPASFSGRKLLGTICLQQGKHGDVQELIGPVLDANPDDVSALNLMANALLRDGKADEGITLLARVAELQPDSPVAQVRLGAGLLMGGKGDDAAQHMETALELNPEFQQADILLVLNHLQKRDYEAAIKAAQSYRLRNLTSTTPLNLLGRVYLAGRLGKSRR